MASHKWDTSKLSSMMIEDEGTTHSEYDGSALPILSSMEAERIVENLRKFTIEEVGSSKWFEQHCQIEKLNLQAHQSAMANSDEYVLEAFLTFGKFETLVHDLLITETWKEKVFPLLLDSLANKNSMRLYFVLYHEATIVNLLEVLMYHKHVCEAGGEILLELVDYVARKLTRMNGGYDFRGNDVAGPSPSSSPSPSSFSSSSTSPSPSELVESLQSHTPREELVQHLAEIEFKVCLSSVAIARYLCEHAEALPLSVISRISDTHDFLILFIPLIENPPWTRRTNKGKWEKLINFKWTETPPIDLLKITKLEGQPWIASYHLIAKKCFSERYYFNTFRKNQLLRIRKYLNEIMLDQLPFLADVQRFMDEMAITDMPEPHSAGSAFLFQQVPMVRERLMREKDWSQVAQEQIERVFWMSDREDRDLREMVSSVYADDLAESVLDPLSSMKDNERSREGGGGGGRGDIEEFQDL